MSSIFYVYVHKCLSGKRAGQVFYVGKGCRKRAFWNSDRNVKWQRISRKYGHEVEICQRKMKEEDAFLLEMWLIAKYRHLGYDLANMTYGGDGASGYKFTDEQKNKLRKIKTGVKMPQYFKDARSKMMTGNSLRKGVKASEETKLKISKAKSGENGPRYDNTIFTFKNEVTGEMFTGTCFDFTRKYDLTSSGVSKIKNGSLITHRKWRIIS